MIKSAQEFFQLCESLNLEAQQRATHDSASEEVWFEVLNTYPELTKWVMHNKSVPLSILRHLMEHPDPQIRWTIAFRRKLDPEMFTRLSQDRDEDVRRQVAYNQKTPRNILELLANDPVERVAEVARRRLETE